ncbi:MAG: Adenylate/guanylate cyclase, partial [Frankiales bacterium]|nr:Adenylate/guanylate cyclase [Frankiales bacterium]
LRGDTLPPELADVVGRGRRSGFPQMVRSALAHYGGCTFLEGDVAGARELFDELYEHTGQHMRGSAREWIYPAVLLGSFVGADRLEKIAARLDALDPKTPWMTAASHIAASHLLNEEGKHVDAIEQVQDAIEIYQGIGDASTTVFARVRLSRCAAKAGAVEIVREQNALVRKFIAANGAVRFEEFLPLEA